MYLYVFKLFQLTIDVSDVNDNPPRFEVPDYQAHGIPEDVPIGTSILTGNFYHYFIPCMNAVTLSFIKIIIY